MPDQRLEPDVLTHNASISACEKGAQLEEALRLFHTMEGRYLEPNVVTHNAAISAWENGAPALARE